MYQSARIKLTAWYLLLIMLISIFFSVVIYQSATNEINRVLMREQRLRSQRSTIFQPPDGSSQIFLFQAPPTLPPVDTQLLEEEKDRIFWGLVAINALILLLAGGAGYFLAGRTLQPIKIMIDEQNRFITDASHELRTPLTSLRTAIEVNLRDKQLTGKDAHELLESNLEDVTSLQTLADSLLQLAHFDQTKKMSMYETVALDTVITSAWKQVKKLAEVKKISFEKDINGVTVLGDEKSLREVFSILFDNAIKYSSEETRVQVTSVVKDKNVVITVMDQGMGIDPTDLPRIFERFYRADLSRSKQNVDGYGLGLSIAKRIVDLHGGTIAVTSKKDVGTTFSVTLPLAEKSGKLIES